MANVIKLRKGLDINLQGKAEEKKIQLKSNGKYALVPDDFEGVTPKVVVKEGDKVKAGDALFVNKQYPEVKFASPVSGTVREVVRGERRKVLCIKVEADSQQEQVDFGNFFIFLFFVCRFFSNFALALMKLFSNIYINGKCN